MTSSDLRVNLCVTVYFQPLLTENEPANIFLQSAQSTSQGRLASRTISQVWRFFFCSRILNLSNRFFVLENPLCKYTEYLYPFHKIKNGSFLNGSFEMDQLLFNSSLLNSYLNMNFNKNWEKLINRYHLPGFCNSRFSTAIVPLSESVKNEH